MWSEADDDIGFPGALAAVALETPNASVGAVALAPDRWSGPTCGRVQFGKNICCGNSATNGRKSSTNALSGDDQAF